MKNTFTLKKSLIAILMLSTAIVSAQEENQQGGSKELSASEIAKELANPNTTLGSLNFNFDYINYQGDLPDAGNQNSFSMSFQPVLPVPLNKTTNLFIRPNIPLYFTQPTFGVNGFENQGVGLGNISADIAIGKSFPSKTIGVIGVFGSFRTASNEALRSPYTLVGPEIAVGQIFKWGVLGLMINHAWSVNKQDADLNSFTILSDDLWATTAGGRNASITSGQYFYNVNLKNGWQIAGGPTYSYNHKAEKGNKLTLPIGGGAVKVVRFGKLPMKFNLQYWYYVASPELFGPQHQVRLTISPVVPLPW